MTLTPQIRINGKVDSSVITKLDSGKILVGSITMQPEEVNEFCESLKRAVRDFTPALPTAEIEKGAANEANA